MIYDLNNFIAKEKITRNKLLLYAYSGDASHYKYIPQAVVFPENLVDIKQILKYCNTHNAHLTFRAAGTSLSGQAQTDGLLVSLAKAWSNFEVLEEGKFIKTQPGVIAGKLNSVLLKYNRKIGPDPASIHSCMAGGIAANNSSGMSSGIALNPYYTIKSMSYLLPDGTFIDSSKENADYVLKNSSPGVYSGLLQLRELIINNPILKKRIIDKYRIKNTTGYSLNAFLDFDNPVDILTHLLIGSEGTLGFISEIVFETFPLKANQLTGLLFFEDLFSACQALQFLKSMNASALEIMDYNSLLSISNKTDIPSIIKEIPVNASAILFEYESDEKDDLLKISSKLNEKQADMKLLFPPYFSKNDSEREVIWNVRRGLLTSLAAKRYPATSVIIEDIAFAIDDLGSALNDLQYLLKRSRYNKAGIYGHGLDGNVHFIISQSFICENGIKVYEQFMNELAQLVIEKYSASMKAEHGTGRNIAPYLKQEWGSEAVEIMRKVKHLIDPNNILNPDVIISDDDKIHLKNIKKMPLVHYTIDKCIECGFCESVCPSRDYTLTPRMRIAISRILNDTSIDKEIKKQIKKDYAFFSIDTCALDGLCELKCPVSINTGDFIKTERETANTRSHGFSYIVSKNLKLAESVITYLNQTAHLATKIIGSKGINTLINITKSITSKKLPNWNKNIPYPSKPLQSFPNKAEFVYFPCCSSRIMGNERVDANRNNSIIDCFKFISDKAGIKLLIPSEIKGVCCGMAFSSKGYKKQSYCILLDTLEKLYDWSEGGRIPIIFDSSSCLFYIRDSIKTTFVSALEKYNKLKFLDSIEYFELIADKFNIINKKDIIVLHQNCSLIKMNLAQNMKALAERFSKQVIVPENNGCCGFAGDRGLIFPNLTKSATKSEALEVKTIKADGYYSTNIPCNIGMTTATERKYLHIAHLIKDCL